MTNNDDELKELKQTRRFVIKVLVILGIACCVVHFNDNKNYTISNHRFCTH